MECGSAFDMRDNGNDIGDERGIYIEEEMGIDEVILNGDCVDGLHERFGEL